MTRYLQGRGRDDPSVNRPRLRFPPGLGVNFLNRGQAHLHTFDFVN